MRNPSTRSSRRPSAAAARLLAAAAVLLLAAGAALADRVILKSGEAFTGTVVSEDATKVVLKTVSGTMTIPREAIKTVEKEGAADPAKPASPPPAPPAVITPVAVDPAKAAQALEDAKTALGAGEWAKAGGLLEGLMQLDDKAFPAADRLAATGALVTCCLQVKDAQGASRNLSRRAMLATDANDKKRLLAAAEALKTLGSVEIAGKAVTRFEEVVQAAMAWKVGQVLGEAKDLASKAQRLNEMPQLERAATIALKKLEEADVYAPGFSLSHRGEVLQALVNNIMIASRAAVAFCEKERPELTSTHASCLFSKPKAMAWNNRASVYLRNRIMAEDGLKNLEPFTTKYDAADLLAPVAAEVASLSAKLKEFEYYPEGAYAYPYSYYDYYGLPYRPRNERIKIKLITFGSGG